MRLQTKVLLISIVSSILALLIIVYFAFLLAPTTSMKKDDGMVFDIKSQPESIFQGSIQATKEERINLDPSLGTLTSINVKNQQYVNAGDVLLTYNKSVDLSSLEYAEKTAALTLANAKNSLAQAQANTGRNADGNDVIQQDKQQIAINQLALEEAQANLYQAKNTQKVIIKAQESGVAIVGDVNDTTKPIVDILSTDTSVNAEVSEFDYSKVKVGEKVKIRTVNLNNTITGTIDSVSQVPEIEGPSSTQNTTSNANIAYYKFTVKPDRDLQYGFNVQIILPNNDIMVPLSAVKDSFVELKQANGRFKKTKVEVQKKNGQYHVLFGLNVGDKIAKNGQAND